MDVNIVDLEEGDDGKHDICETHYDRLCLPNLNVIGTKVEEPDQSSNPSTNEI